MCPLTIQKRIHILVEEIHNCLCFMSAFVANDWQNYGPSFYVNPLIRVSGMTHASLKGWREEPRVALYIYSFFPDGAP